MPDLHSVRQFAVVRVPAHSYHFFVAVVGPETNQTDHCM